MAANRRSTGDSWKTRCGATRTFVPSERHRPICELVRHMGREIDRYDPTGWFGTLALPVRKQIADCEVYEYVEIMP